MARGSSASGEATHMTGESVPVVAAIHGRWSDDIQMRRGWLVGIVEMLLRLLGWTRKPVRMGPARTSWIAIGRVHSVALCAVSPRTAVSIPLPIARHIRRLANDIRSGPSLRMERSMMSDPMESSTPLKSPRSLISVEPMPEGFVT